MKKLAEQFVGIADGRHSSYVKYRLAGILKNSVPAKILKFGKNCRE